MSSQRLQKYQKLWLMYCETTKAFGIVLIKLLSTMTTDKSNSPKFSHRYSVRYILMLNSAKWNLWIISCFKLQTLFVRWNFLLKRLIPIHLAVQKWSFLIISETSKRTTWNIKRRNYYKLSPTDSWIRWRFCFLAPFWHRWPHLHCYTDVKRLPRNLRKTDKRPSKMLRISSVAGIR